MVAHKTLVYILLIAAVASAAGYALGWFSNPTAQPFTTTSSTTVTTTSTPKTTETVTSTTTAVRDLPSTIPPPANSTAVIRGQFYYNGTIFMTFSIDRSTYSIGETVHMKSMITNLSSNDMSFSLGLGGPMIYVNNNETGGVWFYPEFAYALNYIPLPPVHFDVPAGETKTIPWMTADWNMKGIHFGGGNVTEYYLAWNNTGVSLKGDFYNDHFVPEGQYTVVWPVAINPIGPEWHYEGFPETIPFTITK